MAYSQAVLVLSLLVALSISFFKFPIKLICICVEEQIQAIPLVPLSGEKTLKASDEEKERLQARFLTPGHKVCLLCWCTLYWLDVRRMHTIRVASLWMLWDFRVWAPPWTGWPLPLSLCSAATVKCLLAQFRGDFKVHACKLFLKSLKSLSMWSICLR